MQYFYIGQNMYFWWNLYEYGICDFNCKYNEI